LLEFYYFVLKLNITKLTNFVCLALSYLLSRLFNKALVWGQPTSLSIEPTNLCNLQCPECPVGTGSLTRGTGLMNTDLFNRIIEEIYNKISYLILYFQGEPYIHPEFINMIRIAHKKNIFTVTSTNGQFLTEEIARKTVQSGLDSLIISIDGTTHEVYNHYRKGGDLDKVIEGTSYLVKWKKKTKSNKPVIILQFLVFKGNQHQIPEIRQLGKQLGVNRVRIKTAQIKNYEHGNPLIPSIEKYTRYRKKENGSFEIKNPLRNHCWRLWSASVIAWDGNVVPCCFDKDCNYKMGNLKDDAFRTIWRSNKYFNLRNSILINRKQIDMCRNCTEGLKV
jgi:radical SAM protein with 4Fe4S-binding SPASM domain